LCEGVSIETVIVADATRGNQNAESAATAKRHRATAQY
jgi:hypothetical protein